jgi:uncharacterized protein YaiI (UPF0178 family)
VIIWIDNDACPNKVREIVLRASERREIPIKFVANTYARINGPFVEVITVGGGMDEADDYIADNVRSYDLVITQDIPLADRVVEKNASAISPRGVVFDKETIKEKLAVRDLASELRSAGAVTGGPPSINQNDIKKFADSFDRTLTRCIRLSSNHK